jgi:Conserved TM helix
VIASIKIADSLQQALNSFFGFIPNLIGFLVILLIGFIIARIARTALNKILEKSGVDRALHNSEAGKYVEKASPDSKPSHLIGFVVFWFVFLFAISAAVGALKIAALTVFIAKVQSFLPNIIVAVLIFVIAAALAGAIGGMVAKTMGDTPTGKLVGTVVPGLIMAIGLFMVLNQLHIAPQIVTITYAALLGMLALAGALAFGLGGRDLAAKMLSDAYDAGQRNKDQAKQGLQTGKERAKTEAQQRDPRRGSTGTGNPPGSIRG